MPCPEISHPPFLTLLGSFPDLEELKLAAIFFEGMTVGKMVVPKARCGSAEVVSSHKVSKSEEGIHRNFIRDESK
ncbi:hypothetical protein SUGI_0373950 [Cryptomeria japonica]|nr:hypothetical protein SUGI_0373950 [Cryptomeria japonica]